MKSYLGRVAAITGAASGIGRSLAIQLAQEGCHLSLSDMNLDQLAVTAERALDASRRAGKQVEVTILQLDVSKKEDVFAWAYKTVADHGKVNLVFNNAGVALGATIEGVSYEDFEWIMNINFWGVVHGTKAFLPHLRAAGEGQIVNTSSMFGVCSQASQGTYNASKFAVRGMTEALRQELDMMKCGVSATVVLPGGIKTNIARDARFSQSLEDLLDVNEEVSKANFEKGFITTPDEAAKTILKGVRANKRRVLIGGDARFLDIAARLFPSGYQRMMIRLAERLGSQQRKRN